jgi:DinB superfamily
MTDLYRFDSRRVDCLVCGRADQPLDVNAAFEAAPDLLSEAFEQRPSGSGAGWSPTEVAVHLADMEVSRGWRFRRILSEDEPTIETVDQEALAANLHSNERDLTMALEVFWVNRRANVELLRIMGDAGRDRDYLHAAFGRMTLRALVEHTTHHDLAHLRQILGTL